MKPRVQALVLSGGGVRGLYTIKLLAEIESNLSKGDPNYSIVQHFDMISGTSIGGILALGLASGKTARSLLELIDSKRCDIFPIPRKGFFAGLMRKKSQAWGTAFDPQALKSVVVGSLGDIKLRDLQTMVVIPAVNGTTGRPKAFKTPHHKEYTYDGERLVSDVAMSTSAAPTYFPAHSTNDGLMLDGGLFANLPSFITYHELACNRFLGINPEQIHMMCIGTMGSKKALSAASKGDKGYFNEWSNGQDLLSLMMDVSEYWQVTIASHYLCDRLVHIDDPNVHEIDLADSSEDSANLLRRYGADRAQASLGDPTVREFFKHISPKPQFYDTTGGKI